MEATPEDQHSHHGHQDNPNAFKSMRDHMHPPRMSAPSCIVPPTEQLVIRPHIVPLLPTFHGMESENPYAHIKEFEDERYMEAINACPHHGFDKWLLVSYFYDGMSSSMKQLLETMCGGDFMSKNQEEAIDFLNYVAEVSRGWDELNKGEVGKTKSQPNAFNAKARMYTLNEDIDIKAKVAAMIRRLEELELKKIREVQAVVETPVQIMPSSICQSYEHLVEECPTIPAIREMFGDQANVIGQFKPNNNASYGNTYNSNWRNHPNFSWKPRTLQYTQPSQASQQASNLEQAIVNLNNLQYSISRLTNLNTVQEKGRFPSQLHQNPKGIHEVEAHEGESSQVRDVKALITLRSGKEVELPTPSHMLKKRKKRRDRKDEKIKGNKKGSSERKEDHDSTVKVNIPLLDMIKQMPTYAKFLKNLCTIKRGLNVNKKAFLTEQEWTHATHIWQHDIGAQYLLYVQKSINQEEEKGPEEVCIIDTLVEEHCNQKMQEKLNESLGDLDEGLPKPSDLFATLPAWRRIEEILHLFNKEEVQEPIKEESPKLNLKPLPMELKYTYLEENKKCPVVISSSLTTPQEDLVLNWEKCHFMVQQGIVLSHIISKKGIEVDKAKVELIIKLPPPTTVKGVRQFLGHAGFYRRCQKSFEQLKQLLTTAPIVKAPNWQLPFEVMCDASDFAIELFLVKERMESPM
ncbi:Retrovirus-related Pol polyprotein from transposon 17.6 [Vitis vinifera]|uniref:Retrovirus-related Pol polyprotein from transposon 17.6 n=1 Tax=Vitis vinifera TaxID=29760 RepID=A0A438I3U6_VITVI|nr:Retrovirus-related Pol polyprotein from transposon 17.6 [Vitis vinifera]